MANTIADMKWRRPKLTKHAPQNYVYITKRKNNARIIQTILSIQCEMPDQQKKRLFVSSHWNPKLIAADFRFICELSRILCISFDSIWFWTDTTKSRRPKRWRALWCASHQCKMWSLEKWNKTREKEKSFICFNEELFERSADGKISNETGMRKFFFSVTNGKSLLISNEKWIATKSEKRSAKWGKSVI